MVPAEALVPVLLAVPVVWPVAEEAVPEPEAVAVTELARVMLKEVEAEEVAVPVAVPELQVETWVKEQERTMSRTSVISLSYRIVAMVRGLFLPLSASSLAATQASHSGMKLLALVVEQTQLR